MVASTFTDPERTLLADTWRWLQSASRRCQCWRATQQSGASVQGQGYSYRSHMPHEQWLHQATLQVQQLSTYLARILPSTPPFTPHTVLPSTVHCAAWLAPELAPCHADASCFALLLIWQLPTSACGARASQQRSLSAGTAQRLHSASG